MENGKTETASEDDVYAARVWANVEYRHHDPKFKGYFCVQCQVTHRAWDAIAFSDANLIGGNIAEVRLACESCSTTIGVVTMIDTFEDLAKWRVMGISPAFFQTLAEDDVDNHWQQLVRRELAAIELAPERRAELRAIGEKHRKAERRAPVDGARN